MNFIKYFQNNKYELNKNDCWCFIQDIFKEEHNILLPNHPIMTDKTEIASYLKSNISYQIMETAEKGCIIYFVKNNLHHVGYALNDKKYIHKTFESVEISDIPKNATIYKIL